MHHFLGDHVAFANWSMASLARCACVNVYTVAEVNEGRDSVNPDPRYRLILFREARKLLNVGTVGFYRLVTAHAETLCRKPHQFARISVSVASVALQCQSQVRLMTIGNWLLLAV